MLRRILFAINLLRAMPAYCAVCLSGAKKLICAETEGYMWFLETYDGDRFFLRFAWLMWRYDCYRSHVVFRCSQASAMCSYLIRLLYPPKKDMELLGQIGEGLVIYHGHGTVIAPYSIGKNFSVYQGVTIGRNAKPGREINNPIIGDNVTVFTNAVVAGGHYHRGQRHHRRGCRGDEGRSRQQHRHGKSLRHPGKAALRCLRIQIHTKHPAAARQPDVNVSKTSQRKAARRRQINLKSFCVGACT